MQTPPRIRLATPADLDAVRRIVRDAYTPYISRIGREPGPMRDDYAALIAAGHVHVAEIDGTVQGILVVLPQPGALLLDNIAVAPATRGTGLGRHLLRHAEHLARHAGHPAIILYTHAAMTENQALYTRIGYTETHRATENGFPRIYMRKPLPE